MNLRMVCHSVGCLFGDVYVWVCLFILFYLNHTHNGIQYYIKLLMIITDYI